MQDIGRTFQGFVLVFVQLVISLRLFAVPNALLAIGMVAVIVILMHCHNGARGVDNRRANR
jgi:uncharacterized membrane-anchored protein YitT (DUF2179 family)